MNIIFYFSGTGNSLSVSKYISEGIENAKIDSIINIKEYNIEEYSKVGFIFPVHYTHAPNFIVSLLKDISLRELQHVFIIATFSGSRGYATRDVYKALLHNNKQAFIQEFIVHMPGNYILEYGAFPIWYQNIILKKAEKRLKEILNSIINKFPTEPIKPNLISRIYKKKGIEKPKEFSKIGKQFYTNKNCTLCGMCKGICPTQNIVFENNKVIWNEKCSQCMACIQWCPNKAIEHPMMKKLRKQYTNPFIKIEDMRGKSYE